MKVLLDSHTEIGERAGNVLLAESDVDFIGLWDRPEARSRTRSGPALSPEGFDVALSDRDSDFGELIAHCSVAGIPLVLYSDADVLHDGPAAVPIVRGANVGSALAGVIAHHPSAALDPSDEVAIAWTEPGKPLRRGTAMPFPEPIGVLWAEERSPGMFAAYRDDAFGGATVTLEREDDRRIVGISDNAAHLEAIVLTATSLLAASGTYEPGFQRANGAGEQLLNKLLDLELEFAVWRSHS